ncbi:MAG TPA: PRC and DUF2382 domain-containing protein [Segeticoccus sp.]|uniref:PRC and DUF2382 domain-containing protein n=1 Tax=Segeticoccus sp. TaxID=2706531 RepID=UPI002D7EFD4C|nr:PRC and DUF2382 domain-containing protein [Segeticoccus sp.]HET8601314.1 PRC and DUF2382 domain-containing protein [Segeticoccus sp.]
MLTMDQLQDINGAEAQDRDGQKIGSVGQVYLDDSSGQPEWVTVKTGLFGTKETFVPLEAASMQEDQVVRVPFDKDRVQGAPRVDAEEHLDPDQERELYRYYGLDYDHPRAGREAATTGTAAPETTSETDPTRTTGTGTTDEAMTRSEERMHVGTESQPAGRARLRKYVVTEHQNVTVPVSHEEARLEREPITDANRDAAMSGPDLAEGEHEVVLNAERPTVSKDEVPVERVRLSKETVTGEEQVGDDVRKEQVEAEGDVRDDPTR